MAKKAPVVVEDDEDEETVELEDLDEEADEAPAPKGKAKAKAAAPAAKAEEEIWGVSNGLIPLLKEKTGKDYTPREVRTLLRKLARQENPVVNREVVAGNKSRYSWPQGAADPEIKAVIKMVKGGAIETAKTEALAKLKSDKAAKAAKTTEPPAKKKKAAAPPPPDDDDDEDEDDD